MAFLYFAIIFFIGNVVKCQPEKLVTNSLETRWPHTSFIAEASEFISAESNDYFWSFLDNFASGVHSNPSSSHQAEYERAIQAAEKIISSARLSLLKFALSLRFFSPRIEVFQQIALEYSIKCNVFVDVNNALTCKVDQIEALLKNKNLSNETLLYSIDHVYGQRNKHLPIAILYAQIDSDVDFALFHNMLKKLADDGKIQYVFRHFKKDQDFSTFVGLSGYGVELAIKNTEYKAIDDAHVEESDENLDEDVFGFDFNALKRKHEHLKDALKQFRMHLYDTEELAPLKQWEVADLSFQAAQKIMDAEPEEALSVLIDLSQNFPIRSRSLVQAKVKKSLREEIQLNQALFSQELDLSEGENALFINGISVDVDSLDVFQLFNTISQEESLANAFYQMGFRREYLSLLYKMDLTEDKTAYAVNYRDAFPEYINDLDKDKFYRDWGNSVKLLLQPYFPGMIRPIARNLFTMICILDPSNSEGRNLLKVAHSLFVHQLPLRIGFVFIVDADLANKNGQNDVGVALLNFYNFAKTDKTPAKAINLLTMLLDEYWGKDSLTVEKVHEFFKKHFKDQEVSDVFGKDSDYDSGKTAGQAFLKRSGLQTAPKVLLNGIVLDESSIQADKIEEAILTQIMKQTVPLQKAVMSGRLTDRDNVQNWILDQPEVLTRINNRLLREPQNYLTLYNVAPCKSMNEFSKLTVDERAQCILENTNYLTKSDSDSTRWLSVWLIGDFNTQKARNILRNSLKALKKSADMRISVIQSAAVASGKLSASSVITAILRLYPSNVAKQMLHKFLGASEAELEKKFSSKTIENFLMNDQLKELAVHGTSLDALTKELSSSISSRAEAEQYFSKKDLSLNGDDFAIVVNGMIFGPLDKTEDFEIEDFYLLEKIFEKKGAKLFASQIDKWAVVKEGGKSSDVLLRAFSVIGKYAIRKKRQYVEFADDLESVVNLPSLDGSRPVVEISAIIDPLSRNAQKLTPVLHVLSNVLNCDLKLAMNPKSRLSELPLKRFYRFALSDQPLFNNQGRILTPLVSFRELPNKQLFTLNVIAPDSWMIQPVYSEYDLDNIKMITVKNNVVAKYQLVHILLEGHCFDEVTGNPPRGLQFVLGTKSHPNRYDTIVMANLGYFQLKASPGAWILKLRDGKSREIYEIKSAIDAENQNNDTVAVLIDSFLGRTVRVRVAKQPGMEKENLLSDGPTAANSLHNVDDEEEEGRSLWSSISNTLIGGEKHEKINIFSLASGHLYERFLRIMMLSIIKNTKHPVKFWLLNNYLSPQFRESIPKMAKNYGFEFELIEYKWPRWLHQQTEKIRIMWGYKILFLDVLFPLDVKKIIFVDADQVVRVDMMDLMNFDLGGAPYAYTPFCDSRTSMDGFRFWKQGYWASHLAGRRYHISALYVVDLIKFRQIAAGDRLRGQYQGLSSDPNSLSNLDQDLPNNMIHQVRIKSLPQEWLWCETWCNDESKSTAKTIDLCNNPQTKEPKLDSAMRIIPEWKTYDAEIKEVLENKEGNEEKVKKINEKHEHGEEL